MRANSPSWAGTRHIRFVFWWARYGPISSTSSSSPIKNRTIWFKEIRLAHPSMSIGGEGLVDHSIVFPSAVWTRSPKFMWSIFLAPCWPRYDLQDFFTNKDKHRPSFQSTHFTIKYPWDLLRLKLEIVNTTKLRLIPGLL